MSIEAQMDLYISKPRVRQSLFDDAQAASEADIRLTDDVNALQEGLGNGQNDRKSSA